MVTSSSSSSFTFSSTSSSGSSPESSYNGTLLDVPPLTHDCDYREWVRIVKYNFRVRGTIELIEKEEGTGVTGTKKERAAREVLAEKEKKYLLGCCLSPQVRKNVLLFPLTTTVRQIWHATRKEILGMSIGEQYALLFAFQKLSDVAPPSTDEFFEAMDDRWEHLNRHASFPLDSSLRFITALLGIKNHYGTLYTGFWDDFNGDVATYQDLKDYVEREAEADCNVFDTTKKPEDVKSKSKLSRNKGKNKSW